MDGPSLQSGSEVPIVRGRLKMLTCAVAGISVLTLVGVSGYFAYNKVLHTVHVLLMI